MLKPLINSFKKNNLLDESNDGDSGVLSSYDILATLNSNSYLAAAPRVTYFLILTFLLVCQQT